MKQAPIRVRVLTCAMCGFGFGTSLVPVYGVGWRILHTREVICKRAHGRTWLEATCAVISRWSLTARRLTGGGMVLVVILELLRADWVAKEKLKGAENVVPRRCKTGWLRDLIRVHGKRGLLKG